MEIQQDFRELLELFNAHQVKYLIAGGYALAFHGAPRLTGDLDILIMPDSENAERVLKSLDEFGFGSLGLTLADFTAPDRVVQLGVAPVRVDILTSITGVTPAAAFAHRIAGKYANVPVYYLSREDFIANKRALARLRDLADIEALGERAD